MFWRGVILLGHTKRANASNPQNSTKMPLEATSSNSPCPCDMVSNSSYSSLLSYFHSHGRISKSNTRSFPLAAMHVEVVPIWNAVAYAFFVPAPSPQRNFFCTINFFIYLCLCSCHKRIDQSRIHHLPLSPQFVVYLCTIDLGSSLLNLFWYWKINFEIKIDFSCHLSKRICPIVATFESQVGHSAACIPGGGYSLIRG